MASSHGANAQAAALRTIYDAAFDPLGWPAALAEVGEAIDARASFLFSSHSDIDPRAILQTHNLSQEMVEGFSGEWHTQDEWAIAAQRAGRMRRGTLVTGTELVPVPQMLRTAFYNEFCKRHGIHFLLGSVLFDGSEADAMPLTHLCWYRTPGERDFGEVEKSQVRALVPHFRRALRIQRRIGWLAGEQTQPAMSAMRLASFILDARGRIVHRNPVAAELLASLPSGSSRFGELRSIGLRCTPGIPEAIAACRPDAPVPIVAMLQDPQPRVVQATLMALPTEGRMPLAAPSQARYLLLVELPRHGGLQTAQAVAPLFGLTPAEVRVLGGLLDGTPPVAIAEAAGTSLPTVRTQISNILSKTGTAGQTELLVLLRGLR